MSRPIHSIRKVTQKFRITYRKELSYVIY
jgi:hypothetical protein